MIRSKQKATQILLAVTVALALPTGCKDGKEQESARVEKQDVGIPLQATVPAEPEMQDVRLSLLPLLGDFPMVKLGDVQMTCTQKGDGQVMVTARAMLSVEEDLYSAEDAPAIFNTERKGINDAVNRAMLPESAYLLQVGADVDSITEEDRAVKPLPENLQKLADEIKQLAERPVYRLRTPAQTTVEIPASLVASRVDDHWSMSDISFDTQPLRSLLPLVPERALPQDALVITDGFEVKQRALLREKIEAFNSAAKPYIEGREAAVRTRMLQAQARREEAEKAAQQEAASREESRKAWETACSKFFYDSAAYTGEWKRGDAFGKFTLRISRAEKFPDSLQFVGTLSDTDLPQAELRIVGRCEAAPKNDAPISCVVHVYSGRYDPDVATAEVFDKQDGIMRLSLSEDGSLTGQLTCESWADQPEKAFDVQLHQASKKAARRTQRRRSTATAAPPQPATPAAPAPQ